MTLDAVIDVSHNNGQIDWPAVAKDGIALAFIKAVEGRSFKDPMFARNAQGARAASILVIPYDFLRPGPGVAAATFFASVAGLGKGDPSMLDWEGRASSTCTASDAAAAGSALCLVTGRNPVGYWGDERLAGTTPGRPTASMETWDRFIPRYPHEPASNFASLPPSAVAKLPVKGARFVQYTRTGRVNGIVGDVDRSIWLGTLDQLRAWYATVPA